MRKVITTLVDDLDGEPAEETVQFGLDGIAYSIDLSATNAAEMRDALGVFVEAARYVTGRRPVTRVAKLRADSTYDRNTAQQVRIWAGQNGYNLSPRGRISADVHAAYHAAMKA